MQQIGQDDSGSSKNLLIAFLLIGVILGAWSLLMPPGPAKAPPAVPGNAPAAGTPATKVLAPEAAAAPAAALQAPAPEGGVPTAAAGDAEREVVLENDSLRLVFSSRGAVLRHAVLKGFKNPRGVPDDLVSPACAPAKAWPLSLRTGDAPFDDAVNGALFLVEQPESTAGQGASFTFSDGSGSWVRKEFRLPPQGYALTMDLAGGRGGKALDALPVTWGPGFSSLSPMEAKDTYNQQEYAAFSDGASFKKVRKDKKPAETVVAQGGPFRWAAVANNYFAVLFVPDKPAPSVGVRSAALTAEEQKDYPTPTALTVTVPFSGRGTLQLIPKESGRLREMGGSYYRLLNWGESNFGNAILHPICVVLLWALKSLFRWTRNYGLAIILLTFFIRLAFFPLTQKSMVNMREMGEKMKALKPQVDRIKSKYQKMPKGMETRNKMNEEMMALYNREGINPLGGMAGCLPILLQMPIFFALFTMLPRAMELRGAPFMLWIHDLSVYDPYYITPLLMGASMAATTLMTPSQLEGPQKAMMWLMPVVFTFFCIHAPAGLTLYWLVNNLLSIGQQTWVNRVAEARKEAAARERRSTPKGPSKKS